MDKNIESEASFHLSALLCTDDSNPIIYRPMSVEIAINKIENSQCSHGNCRQLRGHNNYFAIY